MRHLACHLAAALSALAGAGPAPAQSAPPVPVQQVEVVGTAPLPGQGIERDRLPYATQVFRRDAFDAAGAAHLGDLLARRATGVDIADIQGSPLQGELRFRGFRASGLLGAAQGLSVYLDGVRINEAFGDVVNWDLVPEFAIQSISLVPGANPAFGLNTLGGAIALTTATAAQAPGLRGEVSLGAFGRRKAHASYGAAADDGWQVYAGASAFEERGWRDHSPGRNATALVKLGRQSAGWQWSASVLAARSALTGNGLTPLDGIDDDAPLEPHLLWRRWGAIYTHPDRTEQQAGQLAWHASAALSPRLDLQAMAYVRSSRRQTLNGDVLDAPDDDEEQGESLRGPRQRALDSHDAPNAALNRSRTRQRTAGFGLALEGREGAHRWQLGLQADRSRLSYEQSEQEGFFTADRSVRAGDEAAEFSVGVTGRSRLLGLYASDHWQWAPGTFVTATVRFNHARVANRLTTVDDEDDAIEVHPEERFTYRSANPALGISHQAAPALTLFANLARNTRVPTVLELGCADPQEPCRLPAGLQSDPYLAQVRSTSQELGGRWRPAPGHRVEAVAWRTDNRDDILFASVSTTSQLGYFRNFGRTRHQGVDLSWQGRAAGGWSWQAGYSALEATYRSAGLLRVGERNIAVTPGMRMAGLPRHGAKLAVDRAFAGGWTAGADLQWTSRRIVQGNEDGRLEDDEPLRRDLSLPGYAVLNLQLAWRPRPGLELALGLHNATDRRAASWGALAPTRFDAQGALAPEAEALFAAPVTPRAWTLAMRWRL